MFRGIVLVFICATLAAACGGSTASDRDEPTVGASDVATDSSSPTPVASIMVGTMTPLPAITPTAPVASTSSPAGDETPDPDEFVGMLPTYTPDQIAEAVNEGSAPAPLDTVNVPSDYISAKALIARLPERVDGLVREPLVADQPGYAGVQYLPVGADAQSQPPAMIYAMYLPESDPSMVNWTADDKVANDTYDAASAYEGGLGTVPPEEGHDDDLYWLKSSRDGVRITWGLADSPVVFQILAPSELELQLLLDTFAEAAAST